MVDRPSFQDSVRSWKNTPLSGMIVRPEVTGEDEFIASQAKTAKTVIKSTEVILNRNLGLTINLTAPEKVVFKKRTSLETIDANQVSSSNLLARTIRERNLPLPTISNLSDNEGIVIERPVGPQIGLTYEGLGGNFRHILPNDPERRELLSFHAFYAYRNLLRAAILSQTPEVRLTPEANILKKFRESMLETIRGYAVGDVEQEILDFAQEVEELTADESKLSVMGKGLDLILYLEDQPLFKTQIPNDVLTLIEGMMQTPFQKDMLMRADWFVPIERWKFVPDDQKEEFDDKNEVMLETVRSNLPSIEIPNDPKELLRLFTSGELALASLIEYVGRHNIKPQEELRLIREPIPEPEIETQQEKTPRVRVNKKKEETAETINKPNAKAPRLVRKRLPRKTREPEVKPIVPTAPVRHEPPPEFRFITRDVAEILRKNDWQAFVRRQRGTELKEERDALERAWERRVEADFFRELTSIVDELRDSEAPINENMRTIFEQQPEE